MTFETNHKLLVDPPKSLLGISTNPRFIIDASDIGEMAYDHDDTDTTLAYMNGCALQAIGPQKQIAITDWFPSGVFADYMTITLNYTTNNSTEPELEENSRLFKDKIFKRHPNPYTSLNNRYQFPT